MKLEMRTRIKDTCTPTTLNEFYLVKHFETRTCVFIHPRVARSLQAFYPNVGR